MTRRLHGWTVLGAALATLASLPAVAQNSTFNVSGWKYEARGDVHAYACEADHCNRTSRVSYRTYQPDVTFTLEQYREQQVTVVNTLQARLPPGAKIEVVAVDEEKNGDQRTLKAQRRTTFADGKIEFLVSSFSFGAPRPFSLISSSV